MAIFTAYVFDGDHTAQKVLDGLENSSSVNDDGWVEDVAVVSKNSLGKAKIHSTWAQDNLGEQGFGWGAFTTALLAALSPTALASGVAKTALAGGSLWGIFGWAADKALDDPKLDEFGKRLTKNTSALVLVSNETYTEQYESALQASGGVIVQTDLNEKDIDKIIKQIKNYS